MAALLWLTASATSPGPPVVTSPLRSTPLEPRRARILQIFSSSEPTLGPSPSSVVTSEATLGPSPSSVVATGSPIIPEAETQPPTALTETLAYLYPDCAGFVTSIRSGLCTKENNNEECGYDGGDCCECTCVDGLEHVCGTHGFNCMDPEAQCDLIAGSELISHASRKVGSEVVLGAIGVSCVVAMSLTI